MNKILHQYPYGFVFSDLEFNNLPKEYKSIKVLDKFNYYYDTYNDIYQTENDFIIIHGHFRHVGIGSQENISNEQLLQYLLKQYKVDYNKFLETLDFIGGRYVIITGNVDKVEVYPDACMCRSLYYTTDKNIVASHVEMIADNYTYQKDQNVSAAPRLGFTLTKTPYSKMKSMLPNILLELFKKETNRFFPRKNNNYNGLPESTKFELIEKLWKDQLNYYVENYPKNIFSLTAGNDSRVSFAMAREHKDKIDFFTYAPSNSKDKSEDSYFIKSLNIDKNVVEQFLKDIPINHKFLIFGDDNKVLTKDEVKVLDKNTIKNHGRFLLTHYNENFPETNIMHIRANLLEIGRAYFLSNDRTSELAAVKGVYDFYLKSYQKTLSKDVLDKIFFDSIDDFHYKELYDYHILDLYYWENRMGRWFSEVLNETDSAFETFLPYNMRAVIDLSLSFSLEKRRDDYMFKELVNRNFPVLNFYGRNIVENLYEQQRNNKYNYSLLAEKASVYNDLDEYVLSLNLSDEILYLPKDFIRKKYYCEVELTFDQEHGLAELEVESRFFSLKAEGYLRYEVLVNDVVLLQEDMSKWKFANKICLMNLTRNDSIKLRVASSKDTTQDSWQKASQLKILSYIEKLTDQFYPVGISCTSPFSIINKKS